MFFTSTIPHLLVKNCYVAFFNNPFRVRTTETDSIGSCHTYMEMSARAGTKELKLRVTNVGCSILQSQGKKAGVDQELRFAKPCWPRKVASPEQARERFSSQPFENFSAPFRWISALHAYWPTALIILYYVGCRYKFPALRASFLCTVVTPAPTPLRCSHHVLEENEECRQPRCSRPSRYVVVVEHRATSFTCRSPTDCWGHRGVCGDPPINGIKLTSCFS